MPSDLQKWVTDTQGTFQGGVSTAFDPDLININQMAWAKNVDLRGGKIRTRGGFVERDLLPNGRVQGVDYFSINGGRIVTSIAGRVYETELGLDEFITTEIPTPITRSAQQEQTFFKETTGFLVVQDGQSAPIIYNGSTSRLATSTEVPRGKHMAYGNGRLWVDVGNGRMKAGDIAGTSLQGGSELNFIENVYLSGGGFFVVPSDIIGMSFMPSNDRTTGYGALIVFGRSYTVAMRADIATRSEWSNVEGFQSTIFPTIGASGNFSIVQANQDMIWRDDHGDLRSIKQVSSEYNDAGSTPLSREVSRITENESEDILLTAHGFYHKSRVFSSGSPFYTYDGQVAFKDIIVQDFAPVGSQGNKGNPLFNGEWEGFNTTHSLQITHNGKDRAFFISKDSSGRNRLWEYREDEPYDISLDRYIDPEVILNVTSLTSSTVTATCTTDEDHNYPPFQVVRVVSDDPTYSGIHTIASTPTSNSFTYTIVDNGSLPDDSKEITARIGGVREVKTTIEAEVELRKTDFQQPIFKKRLQRFDLWLSEIEDVKITIYYRPDHDPQWYKYDDYEFKTDLVDDSTAIPHVFQELEAGQQPRVIPFTSENLDESLIGFEFQVKLLIEGHVKIDKVSAFAEILPNQDVYAIEEDRPDSPTAVERPVTLVELDYEIPVFNKPTGGYVDESSNNYEDELGADYGG